MSPQWQHIFVCFYGKMGVFRALLRKKGSDPYSASMKYVVCLHLYIPWKFGKWRSTPRGATGPSLLFFCLSVFYVRHATMLGTESLHGIIRIRIELGGKNGHKPPGQKTPPDSFRFSFRFSCHFRSSFSFSFRSISSSTTSSDIFYCSGSRQLNHSSYYYYYPTPDSIGTGYCFRSISLFVSLFVSLWARLRENGWTNLHKIFR